MSDAEKKTCPLCGKEADENEIFCGDCREIAQNSFSEEFLSQEEAKENETQTIPTPTIEENEEPENAPPARKSNKKGIIFFGIGLFLMLLVGGTSYIFLQNKNAAETEIRYWNQCIEKNTPLGYSKYLVQYPDGKFSEEAQNRIKELRENERKEWERLKNSNDIDALFSFLADHPETPYIKDIRHTIDSLSWVKTVSYNTADAYLAYIDNVNIGRFTGDYLTQAQERYDYLSQLKTVEGESLANIKEAVESFFKSLSNNDEKDLNKIMAPTLARFYAAQNQSSKHIIDSIKSDFKKNKIKNISYSPILDSIDVIVDNKGIYFIIVPIKEEKMFTDTKKKKEDLQYILHMEMDDKKLFQTIYKD
jgi:hypothetical protein